MRRFKIPFIAVMFPLLAIVAIGQLPSGVSQAKTLAMQALKAEVPDVRFYTEGDKVSRVYGVTFANGTSPQDTAEQFVNRYSDMFEPGDGIFQLEGTQSLMNGKFTAVYFKELVNNYEVDKGYLVILVKNVPGYPAVLANSNVKTASGNFGGANLTSKDAIAKVRAQSPSLKTFSTPRLVAYHGETDTNLAWTLIGDSGTLVNQKRFEVFVDAETGAILEWRDKIYEVDVTGNVKGHASPGLKPDQPNNPAAQENLVGNRTNITGGNFAFTDANGNYVISNPGTTPVTVNGEMKGRWVRVVANQGTNLVASQSVTPPGPADFAFNTAPTQFNTSQVNAFKHVEIVHDFAKAINAAYPGIDVQFPANVNIAQTCNANYNGTAINFFAAGGGCPNTAYSTVVYHEYGHFIIDVGHPTASGDYHEGMADVTAALLSNNSWLGEDFQGQGTGPLRNTINGVNHPCSGAVHTCGQVISGAFWLTLDAMKAIMPTPQALTFVRSWYLNSILIRPADIGPAVTIDVLTLDDNDGNLNNGTPHYTQIAQGFNAKNLTAPPIAWLNFNQQSAPGELVTESQGSSKIARWVFTVSNGAGTLDPNSFKFHYRVMGGAWQELPVINQNGIYRWAYRAQSGTTIAWYLSAKDTQNHTTFFPNAGQSAALPLTFGNSLQTLSTDTFETDLGWTVQNTSITAGIWTRADPNVTNLDGVPSNPENDSADTGALCWFTGQGTAGGAVGTQDVDGGPTRLVSPTINMSGGAYQIQFRQWYFSGSTGAPDPFTIEISNNNGASWVPVRTVQYTGTQNQWLIGTIWVGAYITPTAQMRVRFNAIDNPNDSITEAAIDEFIIKQVQ